MEVVNKNNTITVPRSTQSWFAAHYLSDSLLDSLLNFAIKYQHRTDKAQILPKVFLAEEPEVTEGPALEVVLYMPLSRRTFLPRLWNCDAVATLLNIVPFDQVLIGADGGIKRF